MTNPVLVAKAYVFAAERHTRQRRKGVNEEPYMNHLVEVAALVAEATEGKDPNLTAAAVLHDTIEDTPTSHAELEQAFNRDVADLVADVTDDKSLAKADRKALQVSNAPKKSSRAKIIKIADKTSNLRSLLNSPPGDWSDARRSEYLAWARQVVAGARGVNAWLEDTFDASARELETALEGTSAQAT
ncbi:MAG: bifunctional (p)ppGpp synthetase/guanosine-3',5'-bis(diphosphate) 3'-pyrophosphohydrolase [Aestuariivirga sp.]|nr:bifunctional (p)ppGpp synthetase/guanosine-3',5'-bis(diphosphate) 3'-pyrophosphohydrolase [Aestuariivirga sp.]